MRPQGPIFVGLPHLGPILIWIFTRNGMSGWCEGPKKLPWCPLHKVILLVWTTIYSVMGYASYLVWKDLGGGFGWPLALPLGLYALQLPISWTVLMFFLEADNPGLLILEIQLTIQEEAPYLWNDSDFTGQDEATNSGV
uniref:Translocator protein 2 isoform X2 n=1 Tax=Castor canadensis TaxID=51338 RepID=A0A8B7VYK2_CASCN|nr:translocator protein 2 isoform X2 [Castor canadensis]